jgi:hypothetical protein
MKRMIIALFAIGILLSNSICNADTPSTIGNIEYEKLKVLQPLVGTWRMVFTDEAGATREWLTKVDWSVTRKMIVARATTRTARSPNELAGQEWHEMGYAFYVWNPSAERIELFNIGTTWGSIVVSEVTPRRHGIIVYSRIRGTKRSNWLRLDSVSYSTWTTTLTRCDDARGRRVADVTWTLERVEDSN